ncbi:hypothetical protein ACFTSF_02930 [Kribbella sp. NPDC056951]|uniref:hypothetical protein n=1 Tax=Kribbella sp. NPDC056951 TaxID=3345978 RepID=UPI0036336408
MPPLRLVAIVAVPVLVAACAQPEARYPQSLAPCDLLPTEAAHKLTDVGAKLGGPQPKESQFIVPDDFCLWRYKQEKAHFWSDYKRGPAERRVFLDVNVISADSGGAPKASTSFAEERARRHQNDERDVTIPGIGDEAYAVTPLIFEKRPETTVQFRRSNALVTVTLSGSDCCVGNGKADIPPDKRRKLVVALAQAVDDYLLQR